MLLPPAYLVWRTAGAGEAAVQALLRPTTWATLGRTLVMAGAVTAAAVIIGVPLAWLTTSTDLPFRRFWALAAALPLVIPSFVFAYLLVAILGPRGMVQQVLQPLLGVERLPEIYGFPGAFLALTLISYPFVFLGVRAALLRLDPGLLEAARSLGASPRQAFWRVTVPQLRPAVVAGSLLVALYVLRDFGAVAIMRYDTFTRIIYVQYRSFMDRSLAAALALVLVGLTAAFLYLESRSRGRAHYARRSAGAPRAPAVVPLGRWRLPALLFVAAVVGLALILPAAGLVYWLARGLAIEGALTAPWRPAGNSLAVSLGAAMLTMGAALPVAILSVRRPSRLSRVVERLTYGGFALPGIVIALALVFFGIGYARSLYQTTAMLLIAYVVLFVPEGVGAARASLLQVSPSLEEAGRSLGRRPLAVFRRVTLPLLRPGVSAGAALVFLTAMKELPVTLILSPAGFRTLSTTLWANVSEAFFAQAAVPALLLILLSSIPLAFLTFRDR
jgi:iron(III) transport system permease protein